ncbi:zinc finger (RING)-10 [Ciona intestinalis]
MIIVIYILLMLLPYMCGGEPAFIQVVLYEPDPSSGRYTTRKSDVTGIFARAGSLNSAEGEIKQIHPLSLCNVVGDDQLYEYGWVGVVELGPSYLEPRPCLSVYGKAKRALEKGATAVIFDITNQPDAVSQLSSEYYERLDRPIVLVQGESAFHLINLIQDQQVARARIQSGVPTKSEDQYNQYFNMAIFMGCFVVVFVICIVLLIKLKCWRRERSVSMTNIASETLRRMKTRKFRVDPRKQWTDDCSNTSEQLCAICLEVFNENEELRVIPCSHEFHKHCVDPWLKEKLTCPLCNFNILGDPPNLQRRSRQISSPSVTSRSTIHVTPQRQIFNDYNGYEGSRYENNCPPYESCYIGSRHTNAYHGGHFTELFCDAPNGAQILQNNKFDVVPCVGTAVPHNHYFRRRLPTPQAFDRSSIPSGTSAFQPQRENVGISEFLPKPTNREELSSGSFAMPKQPANFDLPPAYESLETSRNLPEYCATQTCVTPPYRSIRGCSLYRRSPGTDINYRNTYNTYMPELGLDSRPVSLRSGYLPDSDGVSDKFDINPYLFGPFSVTTTTQCVCVVTDTTCCVTDTSVRSVFGSSLISDAPAPPCDNILKNPHRSSTPCIGYSSSDAEVGARMSVSSLEGVLESVSLPTVYDDAINSDEIWFDDVILNDVTSSTSPRLTNHNRAGHVTTSTNHAADKVTRCAV